MNRSLLLFSFTILVHLSADFVESTALIEASKAGQLDKIRVLAKSEDVNAKDERGRTALIWAAENGHAEVVKLLIKSGARIDERDQI